MQRAVLLSIAVVLAVGCQAASSPPTVPESLSERAAAMVTAELVRLTPDRSNRLCSVWCGHGDDWASVQGSDPDARCESCLALLRRLEVDGFRAYINPVEWNGPPSAGFAAYLECAAAADVAIRVDRGNLLHDSSLFRIRFMELDTPSAATSVGPVSSGSVADLQARILARIGALGQGATHELASIPTEEVGRRPDPVLYRLHAASPGSGEAPWIAELRRRAASGDLVAMYRLGSFFLHGNGVFPDRRAALAWFRACEAASHEFDTPVAATMRAFARGELDALEKASTGEPRDE